MRGDVYCKELIMYHCISKTLEYSSIESKTASETRLTVLRRGRKFLRIEKSLLNSLSVLPGVRRDSYVTSALAQGQSIDSQMIKRKRITTFAVTLSLLESKLSARNRPSSSNE